MTLDERLDAARRDYRQLVDGVAPPTIAPNRPSERPGRPKRRALIGAGAAVVLLFGTLMWLTRVEPTDRSVDVTSDSSASTPTSLGADTPDTTAAIAPEATPAGSVPHDPAVAVTPKGPYQHGQQVIVSTPTGYSQDWWERPPRQCAAVTDPAGTLLSETCDPLLELSRSSVATGERQTATITLSQVIFTATGFRDCGDPNTICRLLVSKADGTPAASERLTFNGPPVAPPTPLDVTPTDEPGTYLLSGNGIGQPDRSLSVCAFGEREPQRLADGRALWEFSATSTGPVAGQGCASGPRSFVRAQALEANTVRLTINQEVFGAGGWTDCAVDECFVKVSSGPSFRAETAAMIPFAQGAEPPTRPHLQILDAPPYHVGQQITIELSNLPDDYSTWLGTCHADGPWACGYHPNTRGTGNRTTTLVVGQREAECGATICYLEIDSEGEGIPPLATTPLPIAP